MIAVMGATGRTGKRVVESLLRAGQAVRAIGRSEPSLAALVRAGAEVRVGDPGDAGFLTEAFRGADAAYTLLPYDVRVPDYRAQQDQMGEAVVAAIREAGLLHVVALSSVGADQGVGTGPIDSLHAQEKRLRALAGVNVLVLRAGSFFENFFEVLPVIRHQGLNADVVEPERAIPMIGTRDIADAAVAALRALDWTGFVVRELLGPRDLSYAEATRILGARIGQPALPYMQLPPEDMVGALVVGGFSEDLARLYVELGQAINAGRVRSLEGRTPANTTPTRFEDFADELARAYATA